MRKNEDAVRAYDEQRQVRKLKCVDNPDGSTYASHQLSDEQWDALPYLHALLDPYREATVHFQSSSTVTSSLVIPIISSLYLKSEAGAMWIDPIDDTELSMELDWSDTVQHIASARATTNVNLATRFFHKLNISKLEDYALATVLDPCFKDLNIPGLELWDNGKLKKERIYGWLRGAWHDEAKGWRPKHEVVHEFVAPSQYDRKRKSSLLGFTQDTPPTATQAAAGKKSISHIC